MGTMKIRETIVVEGKHDLAKLNTLIEANIVMTQGSHLSQETLNHLKELNEKTGIIIFTDPDHPGKMVRDRISQVIPNAKHAHLSQKDARSKHKVGIEHASDSSILEALSSIMTPTDKPSSLTMEDLFSCGLNGDEHSSFLRTKVAHALHLQEGNAKHFLKQCQNLGITLKEIQAHV